ncbi:MAG: GNAT family N-acetyltransferase [Dehalococcoidia bacterium]|jgi:ribosomal-protein-serine acetyltransferase|nr:GNAT family N-acetyltransferase [Dehalococcoidia bacterium]
MAEIRVDNKITLRTIAPADARPVFELIDSSRERFHWIPTLAGIESVEEESLWIDDSLANDDASNGYLIIFGGQIAGGIGHGPPEPNGDVNVGYWIASEFEGRGIVTRSAAILVDRLFDSGAATRARIRAGKDNTRSRAVAERLGFSLVDGPLETMELANGPIEMVSYSMLATDWPGAEKAARRR